jgi:cytochrome oxidase assembly protein ShyY1
MPEPWPLPVHGLISAVYVLTMVLGTWLVGDADQTAGELAQAVEECA